MKIRCLLLQFLQQQRLQNHLHLVALYEMLVSLKLTLVLAVKETRIQAMNNVAMDLLAKSERPEQLIWTTTYLEVQRKFLCILIRINTYKELRRKPTTTRVTVPGGLWDSALDHQSTTTETSLAILMHCTPPMRTPLVPIADTPSCCGTVL